MIKIGQLAQLTGLKVDTLRFYERKGLLPSPERTPAGYRLYDETAIKVVMFIRRAKEVGFSLTEIDELLTLRVEREVHSCSEVKAIAEQKLSNIESKLTELKHMQQALQRISEACCSGSESAANCTILNALDKPQTHSYSEEK